MSKILPFITCFLLIFYAATAQPYYFRHYQVESGLSHNTVFCSTQDKKGFLWFGTKDGLDRFDGYQFSHFSIQKDSTNISRRDLILSLATDQKGTVWIGTRRGLFYLDAVTESLLPFLDSSHGINDIFFDRMGQLWFIAEATVNRHNFTTGKTTSFPETWFFNATSLCETADGTMWFSTRDGFLQQFDAITQTFKSYNLFSHSPPAESKVVQKIVCGKRGTILIGTNNQGIKEFDPSTMDYRDVLTYNHYKTTIYVRDILPVSDNETWFATESGIFILNHSTGSFTNLRKNYLDPYAISDNAVYTLYEDKEGGIWAGTFFGGLNYYPKQHVPFQKYFPDYSKNAISGNAVREIVADHTGNIWIGTEDAGLNRLSPNTGEVAHFEPTGKPASISYYNIHGLLAVNDELWVGTFEHGLNILDIKTGRVKKHYVAGTDSNSLKNNFVVSLLQTKTGEIYIGTAAGVYHYNRKKDNFIYLKEVAAGSFVPCLLEDSEGNIWIATHNRGLFYFNPMSGKKGHFAYDPKNPNSLTINSINSIFQDSDKNLWLAMENGGLCSYNPFTQKFVRYTTRNELPSNFVFKILEDDKQTLWITTSKGLVNMDKKTGKIIVYTKADGLLNDQFNYNSGYKDKKGNLYFGSVQGMIKFNPNAVSMDRYLPPVFITGLQVQNKKIPVTKGSGILQKSILFTSTITLPYDQSSFSLDFAALRFASPATIEYSYIMKGLDREWTFLPSNRKVYFTNLKPGTYIFKVKAGNNGWWSEPALLTIVVTPPFWATSWAYLFYAFIILALAVYLVHAYHQTQENKKQREIYKAKMDFFTNIAHEIKTPLTLINGPVENLSEMVELVPAIKDDVLTMERNTARLMALVNQILDFRKIETKGFSLDFSEVNLNWILEECYLTFQPLAKKRGLHYKLELPSTPVVLMADAEALTKVFDNLVSNAVKYAQQQVVLTLLLPSGEDKLLVEISNDGYLIPHDLREKIFEPFFRVKQTARQKGTGLGLALARSLVELHNGKLYVKETVRDVNVFVTELPFPNNRKNQRTTAEKTNPFT